MPTTNATSSLPPASRPHAIAILLCILGELTAIFFLGSVLTAGAAFAVAPVNPGQNRAHADSLSPPSGLQSAYATFYISPAGNDSSNGHSATAALKTFSKAFSKMMAGDELVLMEGTYSVETGTGIIHYLGSNSAQPPSGKTDIQRTVIRAQQPGRVTIKGELFLGRTTRKDSYLRIQGLTFDGGGSLYNTSYVTIKDCGFHGTFGIGTNDHHNGNSYNLIEDVWIWAAGQRIIAINYRSHFNVWRRVLVRGDGCGQKKCQGSGNPNVGITVYDSNHVSFQNVMVVDRVLSPGDSPYADFAVAQHTPEPRYFFGNNEWLGTISLNSPDQGYYMEPDRNQTLDPTIKISNAIAWNSASTGFNLDREGTNILLENLTVSAGGDGIRVAPALANKSGRLRNSLIVRSGRYGVNSAFPSAHMAIFGAKEAFNKQQAPCEKACYQTNPRSDGHPPSLSYLPRIEPGSYLSGRGENGSAIGANVILRYGREGSYFGEADFDILTSNPLWPWANEDRIQHEMCTETKRGLCSSTSLTQYIWSRLGNEPNAHLYRVNNTQPQH